MGKLRDACDCAHKQAEAGPLDTPAVPAMAQALRMVERMAAQNSQHDIVMDYKARSCSTLQSSAAISCAPCAMLAHVLGSPRSCAPSDSCT